MASEQCCRSFVNWIPVWLIAGLVVFAYYVYVIQLCIFTVSNIPEKVIYLVFFHVFLVLMLWSFCAVINARPLPVPPQFFLTHSELREYEEETTEVGRIRLILDKSKSLPVHCRTANGDIRFCETCKCIKPDRAHHCSSCRRCILKMDHHCVWVNGCVCFDNYKLFVLLIAYSCLLCLFVTATLLQYFIAFWTKLGNSLDITFADILGVTLFCIALLVGVTLAALLVFHCNLIRLNRTTMEHSYSIPVFVNGPAKFGFHHGTYANFVDVFGEQTLLWFLPLNSAVGDGVTFPRNLLSESMSKYQSTDASQLSLSTTPVIKTSLQLVQPPPKSQSDSGSDVTEEDELLRKSYQRKTSNGALLVTPVKQQKWM